MNRPRQARRSAGCITLNRTSYNGSTYIFDRAELNDVEIIDGETLQAGHNSIDVYYDIDELGPDDEPDGTPDKDQIVFTYVSADGSMGSVNLEKEVVTRDRRPAWPLRRELWRQQKRAVSSWSGPMTTIIELTRTRE